MNEGVDPMHQSIPVWIVSAILSGIVSYFTTTNTLRSQIQALEGQHNQMVERESNHYMEILRRLEAIDRKLDDR